MRQGKQVARTMFHSMVGSIVKREALKNLIAFAAFAAALGLLPGMYGQQASGAPGTAETGLSPDEQRKRQIILDGIRDIDHPSLIAQQRLVLAEGGEPALVREARRQGDSYTPDPSQTWLAVLRRDMADGKPLELYERLVKDGNGTEKPEELLNAIGRAALSDRKEVRIGGEVVDATPALSLDAGYTKSFRDRATMASLGIADTDENIRKLLALAEGCLDGQNKKPPALSACFTAGIALAAKDATGGKR